MDRRSLLKMIGLGALAAPLGACAAGRAADIAPPRAIAVNTAELFYIPLGADEDHADPVGVVADYRLTRRGAGPRLGGSTLEVRLWPGDSEMVELTKTLFKRAQAGNFLMEFERGAPPVSFEAKIYHWELRQSGGKIALLLGFNIFD